MRKHFKAFKASVSFRKELKTTTLTKLKLYSHVLSCFAMFYNKFCVKGEFDVCIIIIRVLFFDFPWDSFLS